VDACSLASSGDRAAICVCVVCTMHTRINIHAVTFDHPGLLVGFSFALWPVAFLGPIEKRRKAASLSPASFRRKDGSTANCDCVVAAIKRLAAQTNCHREDRITRARCKLGSRADAWAWLSAGGEALTWP
jgi:hypothetical protein